MRRVKGKEKHQIRGHMKRQNEGRPNFEFGAAENTALCSRDRPTPRSTHQMSGTGGICLKSPPHLI